MFYVSNYGRIADREFGNNLGGTFACLPSEEDARTVAAMLPRGAGGGLTTNAARREWAETVREMHQRAREEVVRLGGTVVCE
jgi:hypothetical protein